MPRDRLCPQAAASWELLQHSSLARGPKGEGAHPPPYFTVLWWLKLDAASGQVKAEWTEAHRRMADGRQSISTYAFSS